MKLIEREPLGVHATILDAIKTFALALIALLVGFGWVDWTNEQTALVVSLVAALFVLLTAVSTTVMRSKVTPLTNPRDNDGNPLAHRP